MNNINREDFGKIKNENLQLKLDLGLRDKQITALNSKLSEIKELEEKKRKVSNYDEETNLNISKNKDIPKLKEIFKEINTTLLEYSSKIKILEKNKDIVFGDKFIETTKSNWNKTDNDWKEKLNKFKENHYITMINKYNNEISELKKENKDLINEFKEYNEKIIENMKEMILSLGNKDHNKKIPELKIEQIFSHCKDCSKCYHTCGEILLNPHNHNYIICLKCKMIYKKYMIHLFCKECDEEYYSYIIDYNEPMYEDYFPATWDKYHCINYICEEMVCPKCDNMLYYNDKKKLLKCFGCKWQNLLKDTKWKCELCNKEFTSGVKEYVKFETKPLVNCVRDALVNKIPARPSECTCCGAEPRLYTFNHNDTKCKGILYLGYLQKKERAVCSGCRLVQEIKDVKWLCPKCGDSFECDKIHNNKNGVENRKNNYLLKPLYSASNKKEKNEIKINYGDIRIKMAGSNMRNSENFGKQGRLRGKSYSKKIVMGLLSESDKNNKKIQTSKYINLNIQKHKSEQYNEIKPDYMIKEEDEYYSINEPKTSIKEISSKNNRVEKLNNYILSKKKSKEEKLQKDIVLLNSLQTPLSLGDRKLKYFKSCINF